MSTVIAAFALAACAAAAPIPAPGADGARPPSGQSAAPGNVIFFHPDGAGPSHWLAARLYFEGPDGNLHWDLLPYLAVYRGHMADALTGTSNGAATTHAFGYKVGGWRSFGRDGHAERFPPRHHAILGLSGYAGSIMREAANAGIPVGVVNDGHIAEPGTGAFLAEVGDRRERQEITRQMILGRPGREGRDADPWVILGGGEADTLPATAALIHRNVNDERGAPRHSRSGLRDDGLDLQAAWNAKGSGNASNDPAQRDDYLVLRTRAEFVRLRAALRADPRYAPRVLGLFAFHDLFNDRTEEELIARGFVRPGLPAGEAGPAPGKLSRLVLWGDPDPNQPGHDPPSFAEMVELAITILDRAAQQRTDPARRRFLLVAEQEGTDNFANSGNAVGLLHALRDTDHAIGAARRFLETRPDTLILTAADSDAGGLQIGSPRRAGLVLPTNVLPAAAAPDVAGSTPVNPAAGRRAVENFADGVEGRGSPLFVSEPDRFGQRMQFGILWAGSDDYAGGIVARAAGHNAGLLNSRFSARFDNVDVYRLMYLTLFGRQLDDPGARRAPRR